MHVQFLFINISLLCSIGMWIRNYHIRDICNLKKLEKLVIIRATVTDNDIKHITSLKKLTFWDCINVTHHGLGKLIMSSSKLELLQIKGCGIIDKEYLRKVLKATCNSRSNNVSLKVLIK